MDTNPNPQTNTETVLVSSAVLYNKNAIINALQQEGVLTLTTSNLVYKSKSGESDFTLSVTDIKSVSSYGIYLKIDSKSGQSHTFKFAAVAVENAILTGIDGFYSSKKQEKVEEKSDKSKWIAAFAQLGITVSNKTVAQANKTGTIIAIVIVVLVAMYQLFLAG